MSDNRTHQFRFTDIILFLSLLCIGGFHEYISCALSIALCVYLLLRLRKTKVLRIRKDFLTSAVVAVCLGYGITCLWAIDRDGVHRFSEIFASACSTDKSYFSQYLSVVLIVGLFPA